MRLHQSRPWLYTRYALKLAALPWQVRNFPVILLDHFRLLRPGTSDIQLRSGLTFRCRNNSSDIATAATVGMPIEYPFAALRNIPQGGCVVDLGGHIGTFTIMLHAMRPDLSIFTVEPSTENHQLLLTNLQLNKASGRVVPVQGAVGDFDGATSLLSDGRNDGWYIGEGGPVKNPASEQVRVYRLSTLLRELSIPPVDFMKIDIEGAEYQVLRDAPEIIGRCQGVIMEVHRFKDGKLMYPDGERVVEEYFHGLNFDVHRGGMGNIFYAARRESGASDRRS